MSFTSFRIQNKRESYVIPSTLIDYTNCFTFLQKTDYINTSKELKYIQGKITPEYLGHFFFYFVGFVLC